MSSPEFLINSTTLEKGVNFLEASAGTGKTYTISRIVVRLIAEQGLPVSSILIMTFTEAATKELKSRIRQAIQETLQAMESPNTEDPLAIYLLQASTNKVDPFKQRLNLALASFDEAPIFTIHGFCHRVLNEFAFESNQLFEPTLIKDPEPIWKEAIEDFWRTHYYRGDPFLASVLSYTGQTPRIILQEMSTFFRHPGIQVLPPVSDSQLKDAVNELKQLWRSLQTTLGAERETVLGIINRPDLFKAGLKNHIPFIVEELDQDWPQLPTLHSLELIGHLTRHNLIKELLKKHKDTPLPPSFFDVCANFEAATETFKHQHTFHCLREVHKSLLEKKSSENLLTFDDLLPAVIRTLESKAGPRLQTKLQQSYQAALIDEFQDTDPHQTELFKRLFISPEHFLYFIGDPKQAIYKFRGADIFSYLEARKLARNTYTLATNWRSDPALIDAVNGIFSNHPNPFVFKDIPFLPSKAALMGDTFSYKGRTVDSPLSFCFLSTPDKKPWGNEDARTQIREAICQEILELLAGNYQLEDQSVKPADIAILTRSKREAEAVKEDLASYGLPSVLSSDQTVFETVEALQLKHLLHALFDPTRLDWLRSLYASDWFGWTAEQIRELNESPHGWNAIQENMRNLHEDWRIHGIRIALEKWIRWSGIKELLLAQHGGERSVTNLLHLVELLSQAENELQLTPLSLIQWMAQAIQSPDKERDDFITRLESDDDSIQIVTTHKCKGLQYPIVFIPFAWGSVLRQNEDKIYHRSTDQDRLVFDRRTDLQGEDVLQFQKETLSDAIRLLYVALTRAKHASYLFWGDFKDQDWSSLGYILGLTDLNFEKAIATPTEAFKRLADNKLPGIRTLDVQTMTERHGPEFTRFESTGELNSRTLQRIPDRGFAISSFSSLATGFKESIGDFVPEEEVSAMDTVIASEERTIFSIEKGTVTGNLIHNILEQADFNNEESIRRTTRKLIEESLFENHWIPILQDHLVAMVGMPLETPDKTLRIKQIKPGACLKESEFHFPVRDASLRSILQFFNTIAKERFKSKLPPTPQWNERRLRGFLRGFIDLLFEWEGRYYILDWKSNWLGNSVDDYHEDAIDKAIIHHAYFLQYYIYTLATIRYLQFRLPDFDYERHFGGVYYLFVRGIHESHPNSGVFFDRPNLTHIQELNTLFSQTRSE